MKTTISPSEWRFIDLERLGDGEVRIVATAKHAFTQDVVSMVLSTADAQRLSDAIAYMIAPPGACEAQVTLAEQIRTVKPGAALLLLAQAIDELRAMPAPQPAEDPWAIPGAPATADETMPAGSQQMFQGSDGRPTTARSPKEWRTLRAIALAELGPPPSESYTEDGVHEMQAYQAKERLIKNIGKPLVEAFTGPPPSKAQPKMVNGELVIDLPTPSPELREARMAFALRAGLDQERWSVNPDKSMLPPCAEHYAEGGPIWFYSYDRDTALALPIDMRRAMVDEVQQYDPGFAQMMGTDLLMIRTTEDSVARAAEDATMFAGTGERIGGTFANSTLGD